MAGLLIAGAGGLLVAQWVQPVSAHAPAAAMQSEQLRAHSLAFSNPGTSQSSKALDIVGDQPSMELFIELKAGDTIGALLTRAGVAPAEAARAQTLIATALPGGVAPGADVAVGLGARTDDGDRALHKVSVRAGLELKIALIKDGAGELRLLRQQIAVDSTPLRFRGRSGGGLYWSMRAGGVQPAVAAEFINVIATRLDGSSQLDPDDQFDLVVAHRQAATGESQTGPLLYAGVDRRHGADLQLVNASVIGRSGWIDPKSGGGGSAGLLWPIAGRVSSRFGTRVHPILRFARFHSGVDVSASWGSPIVAAADGQVIGAGWNGGHGRQVRISHQGGLTTSYSHLSQIVADPGTRVRQGQLIGYVGSTGFSTGPHLHYETHQHGRPVDPLLTRHSPAGALIGSELAAIRARLRQWLAIDGSGLASIQAAGGRPS